MNNNSRFSASRVLRRPIPIVFRSFLIQTSASDEIVVITSIVVDHQQSHVLRSRLRRALYRVLLCAVSL